MRSESGSLENEAHPTHYTIEVYILFCVALFPMQLFYFKLCKVLLLFYWGGGDDDCTNQFIILGGHDIIKFKNTSGNSRVEAELFLPPLSTHCVVGGLEAAPMLLHFINSQ